MAATTSPRLIQACMLIASAAFSSASGAAAVDGQSVVRPLCPGARWSIVRTPSPSGETLVYYWDHARGTTHWSPPTAGEAGCKDARADPVASLAHVTVARPQGRPGEAPRITALGFGWAVVDDILPPHSVDEVHRLLETAFRGGHFATRQPMRDCANARVVANAVCAGAPCALKELESSLREAVLAILSSAPSETGPRLSDGPWAHVGTALRGGGANLSDVHAETAFSMATRYPGRGEAYPWHNDATVDRNCGNNPRAVTLIFYAADWTPEAGGALELRGLTARRSSDEGVPALGGDACPAALCVPRAGPVRVLPLQNRLVVLDSHLMHRVLPVHGPRHAVVTWLYRSAPAAPS